MLTHPLLVAAAELFPSQVGRRPRVSTDVAWATPCDDLAIRPTVLIVDDHERFRTLFRRVLEDAGYEVVGEASDGAGALEQVRLLRPAVVILDVQLPDLDGFEVARRLSAAADAPAVVLVSARAAAFYGDRVAASPARGFIPKAALSADAVAQFVG